MTLSDYETAKQVALRLGVTQTTVSYYAKNGRIAGLLTIGKQHFIPAGWVPVRLRPERKVRIGPESA